MTSLGKDLLGFPYLDHAVHLKTGKLSLSHCCRLDFVAWKTTLGTQWASSLQIERERVSLRNEKLQIVFGK